MKHTSVFNELTRDLFAQALGLSPYDYRVSLFHAKQRMRAARVAEEAAHQNADAATARLAFMLGRHAVIRGRVMGEER